VQLRWRIEHRRVVSLKLMAAFPYGSPVRASQQAIEEVERVGEIVLADDQRRREQNEVAACRERDTRVHGRASSRLSSTCSSGQGDSGSRL